MRQRVTWRLTVLSSAALATLLGALTVLILLPASGDRVGPAGVTRLRFGSPIAWVEQDQGAYGPLPRGTSVRFSTPWEIPTTVSWPALVADVAIVGLAIAALVALVAIFAGRLAARARARRAA